MYQKIKRVIKICFILWLFHIFANANDTFYVLPYEQNQALSALKDALKSAKSEIKISIYSFTHNDIAKVLRDSAKNGVNIYIIYDKDSNKNNKTSTIGYLAKYKNVSVCLLSGIPANNKRFFGIMHQKMAIIDRDLLILGSANWSKNAFQNNYETLLFTHQQGFVQKALAAYEKMQRACVGF